MLTRFLLLLAVVISPLARAEEPLLCRSPKEAICSQSGQESVDWLNRFRRFTQAREDVKRRALELAGKRFAIEGGSVQVWNQLHGAGNEAKEAELLKAIHSQALGSLGVSDEELRKIFHDALAVIEAQLRSSPRIPAAARSAVVEKLNRVKLTSPRDISEGDFSSFYSGCGRDGMLEQAYNDYEDRVMVCPGFLVGSVFFRGGTAGLPFFLGHEIAHQLSKEGGADPVIVAAQSPLLNWLKERFFSKEELAGYDSRAPRGGRRLEMLKAALGGAPSGFDFISDELYSDYFGALAFARSLEGMQDKNEKRQRVREALSYFCAVEDGQGSSGYPTSAHRLRTILGTEELRAQLGCSPLVPEIR